MHMDDSYSSIMTFFFYFRLLKFDCLLASYKALERYFGEMLAITSVNPFLGIIAAQFDSIFLHTNYMHIHFTLHTC